MSAKTPRYAVVTGGNKGIGREIVRQLAERGLVVYLGARDEQRGRAAESDLRADGLDVRFLHLDVTDDKSVALAAERLHEEAGVLHVLVNNAGIGGPMQPPSETPTEQVRTVYETNVFGVITVTNALLPLLRRAGSARIVNVSSAIGSLSAAAANHDPTGVHPPGEFPVMLSYATSKSALNAVTLTYANELRGTGILVNAASPGFVATDINGHHGVLTPQQGARIPVLLATLGDDGPTAAFLGEDGTPEGQVLPW
ncbi:MULTISPECIES: SDR family oxidoreductase [Streptomyces]|uniref:Dehydrogenase n=2 Tax=Streptomyces TaxID=1883 RepID=A0A2U9P184_STRAS|nr:MULTISPECIES: SDR family oxidoreductase [Streptomyces]AWT42941.1 dehydrogenase [Streptomyces actuosus]MBM4824933.1 SDR family oxidoreductase [Streptomyces actuosus]GHF71578.1 dehydrogenase [Streptomyces griseosporeus]